MSENPSTFATFEAALSAVHERGGTLWSLGERFRENKHEWYASIHITAGDKTFCASGLAPTPIEAVAEALASAARPLPSAQEVLSTILGRPLNLKINL